ncbi:MAG: Lrp/AsnC family transcriptional regulator [Colwellia sp.]|nr:Lrp/AsnC family transcriptional regulator [Colwellia sp.]
MDSLDRRILKELQIDGRQSNVQLAEKVGLSPSPCWQRVRRMEAEGLIKGYTVLLDQALLGQAETVLIDISLDRHQGYQLEVICDQIAAFPEVLEVHITSGEFDCFVKVACDGTSGYEAFLKNKLYTVAGIRDSRSSFSLRCFKHAQSALVE